MNRFKRPKKEAAKVSTATPPMPEPPTPEPPADWDNGVLCPRCNGKSEVARTMQIDNNIIRYRKCLTCRTNYKTSER